ncbi:leucyl aminopeptidase [Rothia sp. AR01]|uniref:Probable cytosol aminopeptidase n=1 Tax=Rothia santali TaxID=2949643 RepID=A0A9X2HIN9_9MICC|nr:leucyl aminopeptidase [Rothia santali]MCP3425553.1 leucyl aminopeptidase [Rothia santali]
MTDSHELSLSLASPDAEGVSTKALVVGVYAGEDGPELAPSSLSGSVREGLEGVLEDLGISGATDQLHRLPGFGDAGADVLALIGLGKRTEDTAARWDALRYGAGSAVRQLAGLGSVTVDLPAPGLEEISAIAEGIAFGAFYDAGQRTSVEALEREPVTEAVIFSPLRSEEAHEVLARALVLGEAVDHTRRLVNEAPNSLYPDSFAGRALERIAGIDAVTAEVLDESALQEGGFGGILGVGKGSARAPRLVVVDYVPEDAARHVALVGKGITFDSGGLSLKPGGSMMTMKCDMAGAAAALNAVAAAAELQLPVRVTAYLCLAENLPSGTATKPEDVLSMRGGTTVEVLNTDAEGRLVMADGLAYASESAPDLLLDVATLTGAQMVALGSRCSAVMGDEEARESVTRAAQRAGEEFWPMPLPGYMAQELKSPVADLKNIGAGRNGGMLIAGLFLREFVGEADGKRIPWAHLDIAGPAFNEGAPFGFTPKEGTGASVRTLVSLLEDVAGA